MSKPQPYIWYLFLILTIQGCNLDDKLHRESRTIDQSVENGLFINKIDSFRKTEIDKNNQLLIDKLDGWIEKRPIYSGKRLDSVEKDRCNLIFKIIFNKNSPLNQANYNERYAFYYKENIGTSYAGFEYVFDEISSVPKEIPLEVRYFNKRFQGNSYKVIGTLTLIVH